MTSQPGLQTVAVHILPNISQTKGNQIITFGQLIKYNKIFFFKNYAKNEAMKLVPGLFYVFLTSLKADSLVG